MAKRKNVSKDSGNKRNLRMGMALAFLCVAVVFVFVIWKNIAGDSKKSNDTAGGSGGEAVSIAEGESLVIPNSDVSSTASFYKVKVDDTEMELLAVKDSRGNIRTAFNTCQICYSSGRGYYVQSGNALVCQNCGNQFTVDHVEIESGGCNPWPIFPENKTVTDKTIEISYDFLKESKEIFANWKL